MRRSRRRCEGAARRLDQAHDARRTTEVADLQSIEIATRGRFAVRGRTAKAQMAASCYFDARGMLVEHQSYRSREVRREEEIAMSIAKVSEITSTSGTSFEDAVASGIERASRTIHGITGAWVADHEVVVESGKITAYKVRLRVTFVLDGK